MKFFKLFIVLFFTSFTLVSCKEKATSNEVKKVAFAAKMENVSLHISGMTCEIGCAKIIQSKLYKKEGIAEAKVVFKDSIATVDFDANKISKAEIITFIDGIAGGEMYKASEIKTKK